MRTLRLIGISCLACAEAFSLTPRERQLNIDSFEYVWKTIHDKHWQVKPAGLDWQAVHDELRPKIEKAETMDAAREVLRDMLGRLRESHFGIVPADVYTDTGANSHGESGSGIDVRVVGVQTLVTTVDKGSSADAQGVRPGWQILKIGDAELAQVLAKLDEMYKESTLRDVTLQRAILAKLGGDVGSKITVDFLDGNNQRVTKTLTLAEPKGVLTRFGYLWPMHVWMDMRRVDGNIGYVAFNLFLDPARLMGAFADAVQSCAQCAGFVIDLRGNPGGIGAMAMGMAGWFIDKPNDLLGTMYMRDTTLKFTVNPRPSTFPGPVAILVDGASASTSEILAGGMKDLGRARIFGTRTAAAALPSLFDLLPNGDGFQYAVANYISQGGKPLEGIGVTPDVETPLTREALLAGKDPALDAAVSWINSAKGAPGASAK